MYQDNVVLGDFNAVAYVTDRRSLQLHPTDLQHQDFLSQGILRNPSVLTPTLCPPQRLLQKTMRS